MNGKGVILTHLGQELDDNCKRKISMAVKAAVEKYDVTDFYFTNEDDGDDEADDYIKNLFKIQNDIKEYIVKTVKAYTKEHPETVLRTTMFAARVMDNNFDKSVYDDVIQGYSIYYNELEDAASVDAFSLRDSYLSTQVDYVFWCSNKLLLPEIQIKAEKIILIE